MNGFNLHQLDNGAHIRNFLTGTPRKRVPKQVAFGKNLKVVVGGSDHGAVYVFDRETGTTLDLIRHADRGLVQTITVRVLTLELRSLSDISQTHQLGGTSTIVCASSGGCDEALISLWVCKESKAKPSIRLRESWTIVSIFQTILHFIMFVAAMVFVFQNLQTTEVSF
jgi:hypothetical protein